MWQNLGQRPSFVLRRLLLPPRGLFRLYLSPEKGPPCRSNLSPVQHVALFRIPAAARKISSSQRHRRNATGSREQTSRPLGCKQSLRQERRRLFPFSVL